VGRTRESELQQNTAFSHLIFNFAGSGKSNSEGSVRRTAREMESCVLEIAIRCKQEDETSIIVATLNFTFVIPLRRQPPQGSNIQN